MTIEQVSATELDPKSTTTANACASLWPSFARDERLHPGSRLPLHAAPGSLLRRPDQAHPDRALECWSQVRMTIRALLALRRPFSGRKAQRGVLYCTSGSDVLSNGDLADKSDLPDGRTRWHYILDSPHSPVPGDPGVRRLHRTERPRARDRGLMFTTTRPGPRRGHATQLGRTPRMLDSSPADWRPHPHRRYSQVFVHASSSAAWRTPRPPRSLRGLARPAGRSRPRRRVPGVPRAGPSVVGHLLTCREWPEAC